MSNQILTIQTVHVTGLLAALVAVIFGFVIPRILDHFVGQNARVLQELMAIRKEMPSAHPDTMKFDEIIIYRRKRYLKRQIDAYEKLKTEDRKELEKENLRTNVFKRWISKLLQNPWVSGGITVISLLTSCVLLAIQFD